MQFLCPRIEIVSRESTEVNKKKQNRTDLTLMSSTNLQLLTFLFAFKLSDNWKWRNLCEALTEEETVESLLTCFVFCVRVYVLRILLQQW